MTLKKQKNNYMATLTESPDDIVPLSGCLDWTITKAAAGANEIKRIGYKLMSGATEIVGLSASDLDTFRGNFIDDVRNLVDTSIPVVTAGATNETLFEKEVKLTYGDITINTETCESETSVTNDSATVKVINAYTGFLREDLDLLTNRPSCYSLHQLSEDYVWLYGSGSFSITYEFLDGTTATTGTAASFDVNIIPLTPKALDLSVDFSKLKSSVTTITQGANTWEFHISYYSCPKFFDLHWLEPMGSYSTISFDEFSAQTFGENTQVDINSICPTHTRGGVDLWNAAKRIQNITGGLTLDLRKRLPSTHENLMYLKSLGKNRGAYGIFNGNQQKIGCVINPSINIFNSGEVIELGIQVEITE